MRAFGGLPLLILTTALITGCEDRQNAAVSASIQQSFQAPQISVGAFADGDVRAFYEARGFAPAWTADASLDHASRALAVVGSATEHGLDPEDYDYASLQRAVQELGHVSPKAPDRVTRLATLDTAITASLLALGHDVAVGHTDPSQIDRRWKARREAPDVAGTLAASVDAIDKWLPSIQPHHPEYERLRQELARLQAEANDPATTDRSALTQRIATLALNLERWRWMPDDFGERHILVNIPSFQLAVREHGTPVLGMRVVVGKNDGHETPIFSGEMNTVVFSPYWNIPVSIASDETVPAVMNDFSYLERHHMQVLQRTSSGVKEVDPLSVDWENPHVVRNLTFRQEPGDSNSLGRVKFLFPNPYDVYLHDTPADSLFQRKSRALSHGCVRLEKPQELAEYVLRGDARWDTPKIAAAMQSSREQQTRLTDKLPVHIVYFTAWVDESGNVHYEPDIYRYDAKQLANERSGNDS